MNMPVYKITVFGIVQGVGYRPFVLRLAKEMNLTGTVKNIGGIVEIFAQGLQEALDHFVQCLFVQKPTGAMILDVVAQSVSVAENFNDFRIVPSDDEKEIIPIIPPDLSICPDCEREVYDVQDRRFQHPFISCVSCGPRYSIIERLPYDRHTTTMVDFDMCPDCRQEYTTHSDRRLHAQTIACHACGPTLQLHSQSGDLTGEVALKSAITALQNGKIVAIKDIGGYHFACSPYDDAAIQALRQLKGREAKPFAVMFPHLDAIKEYAIVSKEEAKLLSSCAKPIVLLRKNHLRDFSPDCCGDSMEIGAFLPCNPLQIMLTQACGALIMTSGNRSGEPIIIDDTKMEQFMDSHPALFAMLYHNRRIVTPLDDSVCRIIDGKEQLIRRARGYVPLPILTDITIKHPIFAAGGDLKNTFALAVQNRIYLSQHFGDLEDLSTQEAYRHAIAHMCALHRIHPLEAACDMHPAYYSRQIAQSTYEHCEQIQHHHAHIASVIAEHHLQGAILGIAFDGTGYSDEHDIWGGEFLLCQGSFMHRLGHLQSVLLCGGDASSKNAALTRDCYLYHNNMEGKSTDFALIRQALTHKIQTFYSSSVGRLFDGVCAMLSLASYNDYEGQCAVYLENAAYLAREKHIPAYPLHLAIVQQTDGMLILQTSDLFRQIARALEENISAEAIALGFHDALSHSILEMCLLIKEQYSITQIALSGGVFMNRILTESTLMQLRQHGFSVYLNHKVPTNDGGIAFGQAYLAMLRQKERG